MARPNIQTFDPSPYIQATGMAFGNAIEKTGSVVGQAVERINSPEYQKAKLDLKNKKEIIEQIKETEISDYRHKHKLYGEPEQAPLLNTESFKKEGMELSEEFQRSGSKKVTQKPINSEVYKGEQQYLAKLDKQLNSMDVDQLRAYKMGRGRYLTKKALFQNTYGNNAIQWIEPDAFEYVADPYGKEIDAKIEKFEKENKAKFLEDSVNEFFSSNESENPTYQDFAKWFINERGVPNVGAIEENGALVKVEEKPEDGIYAGKRLGMLADKNVSSTLEKLFDEKVKANPLREREVELKEERLEHDKNKFEFEKNKKGNVQEEARVKGIQSTINSTSNAIKSSIQKATSRVDSITMNLNRLAQGIALDEEFQDKTKTELEQELFKAKKKASETEQSEQVMDALVNLMDSGRIPKGRINEPMIRNIRKDVFDGEPRRGSHSYYVYQYLFGDGKTISSPNQDFKIEDTRDQNLSDTGGVTVKKPLEERIKVPTAKDFRVQ